MKYGRSLSFCVSNILDGKVAIEDVGMIVTSTAVLADGWDQLIELYRKFYWYEYSFEDCKKVIDALLAAGKIEQPRLIDGRRQALYRSNGNWADTYQEVLDTLESF